MTNAVVKRPDSKLVRDAIFRMEEYMLNHPEGGVEENGIVTKHHFAPGLYIREMIAPEGLIITGMVHKTEHISIFLEGTLRFPTEIGASKEVTAPLIQTTLPGSKRAAISVTPVRFLTVHATEETDVDKLEEMLCTNDKEEAQILADQTDFATIYIPEKLQEEFDATPVVEMELDGVEIKPSPRHGLGVFVTKPFKAGDYIAPAVIEGQLINFSRYCNHSPDPNAEVVWDEGDAFIMATRDIENEEVTMNYRINLLGVDV